MAAKKGAGKKRRRWGWKVALALVLLLALGLAGLYGASRVVHVRYATAWLRDLPPAFEGTTILFVSDLDIRSEADGLPPRVDAAMGWDTRIRLPIADAGGALLRLTPRREAMA